MRSTAATEVAAASRLSMLGHRKPETAALRPIFRSCLRRNMDGA
jgi:hypothetical protein